MTTLEPPPSASTSGLGEPTATVELPPDPRINEALGLQHRLETAIADLVDNSIDAGAHQVWIRLIVDDAHVREIIIADDGRGMSRGAIRNAFILGARQDYEEGRLGHFGVGMKASAFSQAEQLTVISRSADDHAVAMTARRTVAEAITADVYSQEDAAAALHADDVPIRGATGTVLRLAGIRTASRSDRRDVRTQWIEGRLRLLREHLGLTFHRFLTDGRLVLTVDTWDVAHQESGIPFHPAPVDPLGVDTGKLGYPRPMLADLPGGASISLTCHLLAPGVKNAQARIFGRPRPDWQGVYVYRNDRLLNPGGWGDVARAGADLQLARVAVDVTPATEKWFGMNAEKDGVLLLPDLVHAIQNAGDEDVSFRDFLDDARDVLTQSNRRERSIKPLAPMGSGLPRAVEDLAGEQLGFREFERSVNVRWQSLRPDRLFLVEHDRATIWLNERHRDLLATGDSNDPHGLVKTLLFLLFEGNFKQAHLQKTTIEQIEAWQAMAAVALGVREFTAEQPRASVDEEIAELEQLDVATAQPSPSSSEVDDGASGEPGGEPEDDEVPELLVGDLGTDGMRDYLAAVGRHPLLTAEEEVDLARRIEAGLLAAEARSLMHPEDMRRKEARELSWLEHDGRRSMEKLVSSNLRLVVSLAKRYQRRGLELLDLIQEGNAGLVRAVEKFDYKLGYKFSTYATWWIRQAITRAIANEGSTIRLPVHLVEFGNTVRAARVELRRELDRNPTSAEIAGRLREDVKKVELFLTMSKPVRSLNKSVADGDWDDLDDLAADEFGAPTIEVAEFGDTLVDESDPIESALAAMMLRTQIDTVLDALDERTAGIISMRFGLGGGEPMTLDAVGEVYGVTRERIRQIEKKAFARLRDPRRLALIAGEEFRVAPVAPNPDSSVSALGAEEQSEAQAQPAGDLATELGELLDAFDALVPDGADAVEHPDALERAWRAPDLLALLQTYRDTRHVRSAAQINVVDERDAAVALTRLLLWQEGPIDDFVNAANHGAPWTPESSDELLSAFTDGADLQSLARHHGRTQLAIAWRLLDSTAHPVGIPHRLLDVSRIERHWADIRERADARNAELAVARR